MKHMHDSFAGTGGAAACPEKESARQGRGKSKATMDLIEACRKILTEIQPASVRAVCYRLFTMGLIQHMGKNETNKVSRQLVYAREQGIVPWEWIVDETREAERISTWDDPDQIIRAAVKGYRRDYWQDQPVRVEVWSEKGTVRGTLAPVLNEYGVTFRVMHGFASATAVNDIAELSNETDKPLFALYVGDHDPSGMCMSEVDLPGRLKRYGGEVHLRRIALLTSDTPDLPSFDVETKRSDGRAEWYRTHYGRKCWELDAMPPPLLRQRVEAVIREYIDLERWERAIAIERVETASMGEFFEAWHSNLRQAAKYSPEA